MVSHTTLAALIMATTPACAFDVSSWQELTTCCRASSAPLQAKKNRGVTSRRPSSGGGGGFGSTTTKTKPHHVDFTLTADSIADCLHPRLQQGTALYTDIQDRLQKHQVVVIPNAFKDDVAQAVQKQLEVLPDSAWSHHEDYLDDGYHYRHSNIYSKKDSYPPLLHQLDTMLASLTTRDYMTTWTSRDCTGDEVTGAPSWYRPGDHSLPHTDHIGQRSVAYIWHLSSENWNPSWGGALYWAPEANHPYAYRHASFNTLVLFSVTPQSSHFVTTVSPHAKSKRLAYNGWWHSAWIPTAANKPSADNKDAEEVETSDVLIDRLAGDPFQWTHAQLVAMQDLLEDPWAPAIHPPERKEEVKQLWQELQKTLYPLPLTTLDES